MSEKVVLKEIPVVVMKNTTFKVKAWDGNPDSWNPADHEVFGQLIGQDAQSVQLSDWKDVYKLAWAKGQFDDLTFGQRGKILMTFYPEK